MASRLGIVDKHVRGVVVFVVISVLVVASEGRGILIGILSVGVRSTGPVRNLKSIS